jgi:hypothetical protein
LDLRNGASDQFDEHKAVSLWLAQMRASCITCDRMRFVRLRNMRV